MLKDRREVPEQDARKYARLYFERRRAKGITEVEAAEVAKKPLYTAALMVAAGDAEGFVGGAVNTTAETVRAALQAGGTGPAAQTGSSAFIGALPNPPFRPTPPLAYAHDSLAPPPPP